MIYWPSKGPADIIDFGASWGPFLSLLGDPPPTIEVVGTSWAVVDGDVTLEGSVVDADGRGTTVRVAGGTAGTEYVLRNQVKLSDGQSFHEDAFGKIRA